MSKKGYSRPNAFGGYTHYDGNGKKIGRSDPGFLGGYNHYDAKGHKTGRSAPGFAGGYRHYDKNGHRTGGSDPRFSGGYSHNNNPDGCYIATCVYGSYDCPQVWTLRRFRDDILSRTIFGRTFIRTYYRVSPTLVRWFGGTPWFRRFWRSRLDGLVRRLQSKGIADTPYQDRSCKG